MMELKINKTSELSFKLNIQGSTAAPKARLIFKMDESSELAINGKVENQRVKVEIPPFADIKEKFSSNVTHAYLEVIIDENYFRVWEGEFNFKEPLKVSVETVESEEGEPIQEEEAKEEKKVSIEIEGFKEKEEPKKEKSCDKDKKESKPEPEEPEEEEEIEEETLVPDSVIEKLTPDTFVNSTMSADEYIRRRLGKK